jgi:hypothetical protein
MCFFVHIIEEWKRCGKKENPQSPYYTKKKNNTTLMAGPGFDFIFGHIFITVLKMTGA